VSALLVAFLSGLPGCQQQNVYQKPPPPPVTIAHPVVKTVIDSLSYTGTTSAVEMVDVRARVEGFLQSIEFAEGKFVKQNDLLFQIDPQPYEAALAEAQANVEMAKSRLQSAEAELARAQAEVANAEAQVRRLEQAIRQTPGAVTEEDLDLKRTAVLTAKAAVDAARAAIASANAQISANEAAVIAAELNLSYTRVRSPIDGRAGRKMVDIGNLVGAGEQSLLTSVVRYDPIHVFFAISESDLLQFTREAITRRDVDGANNELELDKIIYLGLSDEEGYPHEGRADYADLAVDQSTGTYMVRGVFSNPKRLIPPGAFVRIRCPRREIEATLVDPHAVGRDQSGAYLLVLGEDNVVERRPVELGNKFDGLQSVKGALSPEDRVIIYGLQRARPGEKVAPQAVNSEVKQEATTTDDLPPDEEE